MNCFSIYHQWIQAEYIDLETKRELLAIRDDAAEIEDRFFRQLEFGTGGLRGKLGAGTNRINRYIVRLATQGLSNYLLEQVINADTRDVVIAYDTRHMSRELAEETAAVLNANGISVYLFANPRPTPELSFAVRELEAVAGVAITASHNPPEYNGYKVYGPDGCQIVSTVAEAVAGAARAVTEFSMVRHPMQSALAKEQGLLKLVDEEMDQRFLNAVRQQMVSQERVAKRGAELNIVYSPLHGTGLSLITKLFDQVGFRNLVVVDEQAIPDPDFPTARFPNPEERDAYGPAIKKAEAVSADLIMVTDPDADRVGVMARSRAGRYELLTGNQTGALLLDFVLAGRKARRQLNKGATVIKTIVTSELGQAIAEYYGVDVENTLTGFKYIGERIGQFETEGERNFVFGFEESFGYLTGLHARDKDAVAASLLIAEMALTYKLQGMTLLDAMEQLQRRHGYHREQLVSWTLEGKSGQALISTLMHQLRTNPPAVLGGLMVTEVRDYLLKKHTDPALPKENALKLMLEHGAWVCVRPSGTEPKIKFYLATVAKSAAEADEIMARVDGNLRLLVETVIQALKEAAVSGE